MASWKKSISLPLKLGQSHDATVDELSRESTEKLFRKCGQRQRRTSVMAETTIEVQSEMMPVVMEMDAVHLRQESEMSKSRDNCNLEMGPNVHDLAPWEEPAPWEVKIER